MSRKRETKAQREQREADALEREDRVAMVGDLLLAGMSDRGIHRATRTEGWDITEGDVEQMITDARAEILAAAGEGSREDHVRMQLAKVRGLYRRALRAGDHRTAAKCLEDERLLLGLQRADRGPEATAPPRARPAWHDQG